MTEQTAEHLKEENGVEEESGKRTFRVSSLVWLVLLILYIIAVLSYDKSDLAILEGGADGIETNLIGNLGAYISRAVFYLFGLAVYPIGILLVFSVVRPFLPFPLKRRGYTGALLSAAAGFLLLFAMYPNAFLSASLKHGIGREFHPEMNLSGGVLGAAVAAPPVSGREFDLEAGILRRHIGETGTLVVTLALLLPGLFLIFMQDWFPMLLFYFNASRKKNAPETASVPPPSPPETVQPAAAPAVPAAPDRTEGIRSSFRKILSFFAPSPMEQEKTAGEEAPPVNRSLPQENADNYTVAPPPLRTESPRPSASVQEEPAFPIRDDEDPAPVLPPDREPPAAAPPAPAPSPSPVPVTQFAQEKPKYDREKPADAESGGTVSAGGGMEMDCRNYERPLVSWLDKQVEVKDEDRDHIEASRERIQQTLESFNVEGHVSDIVVGPRVTRFEIMLEPGVKVEKVTGIKSNIAMDLAAKSIRILAPIPGKNAVGIEVPNKVSSIVYIRSLLESSVWKESRASIPIILGRDISGKVMVTDLAKAPHLLIAGSTGSGKSVCMNSLIMSLLFKFSPAELRLIMVDPKVVELEMYRPIPHLITPVVNDPKKVPLALRWGVNEMERRYRVLAKVKAKNLAGFNSRPQDPVPVLDEDGQVIPQKLPFLIIIIDELADIMMTDAKSDVETSICRIAQKGRAAGVHLVIATQTPRKDVITGLIKANLPTKIAFKVVSNMDSRVILDTGGAETLLGYGDMLFLSNGGAGMERIQGSMVSDKEIQRIVDFVSDQMEQHFDAQVVAEDVAIHEGNDEDEKNYHPKAPRRGGGDFADPDVDDILTEVENENSPAAKYLQPGDPDLLRKALEIIIAEQKASTSYLQRRLGIGYNKSAELMDLLEKRGIISAPLPGGQKREILITDGLEEQHTES